MGGKELQKKLKNKDADSNFVQNEESFPQVTKEKRRKKKKVDMQNRRTKHEADVCHLSSHKDESNNADGKKKKSKSSKLKRKSKALNESDAVDKSNEMEDGIGQEITISSEPGNPETRKSRRKKRKSDKKAGKAEGDGVPKRQRGNLKDSDGIVEKDHPFPIPKDNCPVEREQAEEEEIYELSSGDEDYSRGMRRKERKKDRDKEDGWTVVVHHKGRKKNTDSETGIAVGSVSQAAVMDNMAKKKNKDVGLDFYRFQKREAKRNEIMVLQSKFEQDKKRIQQLRAARKFRPY
ncbi:unnamed protein product [Withania somnifera]